MKRSLPHAAVAHDKLIAMLQVLPLLFLLVFLLLLLLLVATGMPLVRLKVHRAFRNEAADEVAQKQQEAHALSEGGWMPHYGKY